MFLDATYTVTSLADTGASGTLRWAVGQANSDTTNSYCNIEFSPSLTVSGSAVITLNSPLEISNPSTFIDIMGPGVPGESGFNPTALLTITDAAGTTGSVLQVDPGVTFAAIGVTFANADAPSGIISNSGTLYLYDSTVSGNTEGSGITNAEGGNVYVYQSTISNNWGSESGGGIANQGNLTVTDSTMYDNTAGNGGEIFNDGGAVTVASSTITGDTAHEVGSYPEIYSDASLTLLDCTISGSTDADWVDVTAGTDTLYGTIIAGAGGGGCDIDGVTASGTNNLIGDGSGGLSSSTNTLGEDPELAPLGYFGGPTQTMPPIPSISPAIGAGVDYTLTYGDGDGSGIVTDQRGQPIPSSGADIGAFQSVPGPVDDVPTFAATTTQDSPVSAGDLSLRDAIDLANITGEDGGPGSIFTGSGSLAPNSAPITINAGSTGDASLTINTGDFVDVEGSLSDSTTTVNAGGTLTGSGNLGNVIVENGATFTATGTTTASSITVAPGGTVIASGTVNAPITVENGGTLEASGSVSATSLTVQPGGLAEQTSTNTTFGASVITLGSLAINGPTGSTNGGVLDLGNGDLIVRQTPASEIEPLLAAGYDGGLWDGVNPNGGLNPAAIISAGAANDPYGIESLGYAAVGSATDLGQLNLTTYDGQAVSAGDVIAALTYYGDANLDRSVDSTDYGMIGTTCPGTSTQIGGWTGGDFTYCGSVTDVDFDLLTSSLATVNNLAAGTVPNVTVTDATDATTIAGSATSSVTITTNSPPPTVSVSGIWLNNNGTLGKAQPNGNITPGQAVQVTGQPNTFTVSLGVSLPKGDYYVQYNVDGALKTTKMHVK
jgi:hypothetical protein